ncbi:glycerol-3-phosphate 1-O-acyltransferase PlsY [Candidatus Magnetaquicoccus inordinatus]|uniref:glycerol-3-phosphate 1-O-acyltransferase PlsY n=1 Tax=Candidatus Magnetaquicoccus inordinatus TaxID=2496818 RepID=UPI00102BC0FA|nr:glycerol-3-phosphate 1-O-acyltransferase PlsY [Candidatus Magnetaquicoccus inordinatus]
MDFSSPFSSSAQNLLTWLIWLVTAYLLGAIPFGLLVARLMGSGDIRQQGSGNIGATNVLRTTGKLAGIIALLLDMAKGFLPLLLAKQSFGSHDPLTGGVALAAFLGHLYPIYLRGKGGKGVATALGIFLAWTPSAGLLAILTWLLTALFTRISSLAALLAFLLLPAFLFYQDSRSAMATALCIIPLIFWRHRSNIQRLAIGSEPRIGRST